MKTDLTEWNDPVTIRWTGQTDAGNAGEQPARDNRLRATDSRGDGGQKPVIPSSFKIVLFRALKCLKKLPAEGRFYRLCVKGVCPVSTEPIHYRARSYDPQTGRFLQRDPAQYIDGMNLYEYVASNPLLFMDFNGQFMTHGAITKKALDNSLTLLMLPSRSCGHQIMQKLIKANSSQDSGKAYNDLRRHYNRKPDEDAASADNAYQQYFNEEYKNATDASAKNDCAGQLEAIGKMDHTLEDFYGHAVGPNGETELWTNGTSCTPYNRSGCKPSSYPGEHPAVPPSEPGSPKEEAARKKAAIDFMTERYKNLLPSFLEKCACQLCK
jgi:hypothetical protein